MIIFVIDGLSVKQLSSAESGLKLSLWIMNKYDRQYS